jgi:hypothetical protein
MCRGFSRANLGRYAESTTLNPKPNSMSNSPQPEKTVSQLKVIHNELLRYLRKNVEDTKAFRIQMILSALLQAEKQDRLSELVNSDIVGELVNDNLDPSRL